MTAPMGPSASVSAMQDAMLTAAPAMVVVDTSFVPLGRAEYAPLKKGKPVQIDAHEQEGYVAPGFEELVRVEQVRERDVEQHNARAAQSHRTGVQRVHPAEKPVRILRVELLDG